MKSIRRTILVFISTFGLVALGANAEAAGGADRDGVGTGNAASGTTGAGTDSTPPSGSGESSGTGGLAPAPGTSPGVGTNGMDRNGVDTTPREDANGVPAAGADRNGTYDTTFEQFERDMTVLRFVQGAYEVTATQRAELEKSFSGENLRLREQNIMVIAWSDKDFPTNDVSLTDADKKLAENRGKAVSSVLKDLGVKNVDVYNMAERPSWISQVFSTQETKIKDSYQDRATELAPSNENGELHERIASVLKAQGGPSTVVVGPAPETNEEE